MLVVKDRPQHNFSALERIPKFTICSPCGQAKTTAKTQKIVQAHGVEQAFMPAVGPVKERPSGP
jgi:hypothetical protein